MSKKLFSFFIGLPFMVSQVFGQAEPCKTAKMQPTLIIIPFIKSDEDFRTILEKDPNKRTAVSKVTEAFDLEGYPTKDFFGTLNAAKEDQTFMSGSQEDAKSALIAMSGADIYVDIDLQPEVESTLGKRARIILKSYFTSNGLSLGSTECVSRAFETKDFGLLVSNAMEGCRKAFLATMQTKFDDVVENGRPVKVIFNLKEGSTWNFDKELAAEGLPLVDVIREWMEKTAYKGLADLSRNSKTALYFDEVRMPLFNEKCKQYKSEDFALEIFKFLKTKGINCDKVQKSGSIYITLK
jgi:hypothetical protein